MTTISQQCLLSQSDTYSLTLSTLFPNEIDNNDDLELSHLFQSTSLEDHLRLLKRAHLNIPHVPRINLLGDFHKNIEITMHVYKDTLLTQIKRYTHQQKIEHSIRLLKTYQLLIKEYGHFLITHQHIRVDDHGDAVVWINQVYTLNECSLPIKSSKPNAESLVVGEFIKIIKQYFAVDFFKYRKIESFTQLLTYLEFIKKRNRIHKNCGTKARELSECKRRTTLSVKNMKLLDTPQKRYDRYSRPISTFSTILTSNILSRGSREKYPSQSFLNSSSVSRVQISKGSSDSRQMKSQVDTTVVSSELKNTRNISYLQLSNIIQNSQKKSCVFGSNPEVILENSIKHSSVLSRGSHIEKNNSFCPVEYKLKEDLRKLAEMEPVPRCSFIDKKNSLEIGLNNLLLSQINEDPENQTGGSDLKKRQHLKEAIEEFESLLCN